MDAALMLEVIAGYDPQDSTSIDASVPDYAATIADTTSSLRLGIPRAYFYDDLHPEIQAAMEAALSVLRTITASEHDVPPPLTDATYSTWMDAYSAIFTAEAYAYHKDYIARNPELYQVPTLKRLRVGADVTTATYIQSRRWLDQVRRAIAQAFDSVDLLITPTVRVPPFTIADLQADADTIRAKELAMLHNTRPWNFPGLPTISVPSGFTRIGLPIGMQITGPPGGEAMVLRLAYAYEQVTGWYKRKPNLG
jgi:aspartyl-tRNA(Asn)/glutamyl-tRNA(Gln) amidotransferase subunit A